MEGRDESFESRQGLFVSLVDFLVKMNLCDAAAQKTVLFSDEKL